jgi:AcrR family transcriptional regulator
MSVTVITYDLSMGRWEPNARGRLERAALELYAERGFEQTTVAEIAERAGLTERTFFRHFADKREVLFAGSEQLQEVMVGAVLSAPNGFAPIEAVTVGVEAAAAALPDRAYARMRHSLIAKNPILQERELIKMATLAAGLAQALRQRGVREPAASLAAEAGVAVFRISFERWVGGDDEPDLLELMREGFEELKLLGLSRR